MENNNGQILCYQTVDGESKIEVTLANDTVWLTLEQRKLKNIKHNR